MNSLNQALRSWAEWESEIGWHIPDNIEEGVRSQREELEFAAERAYDEIIEASEVAEAVDRAETGEDFDLTAHFDYTNEIDREYENDEEQLRDELGYELADIGIFTVKMSTGLEQDVGEEDAEGYRPDFEGLAQTIESHEAERPGNAYREAVDELGELLEPEKGEIREGISQSPVDQETVAEGLENLLYGLSDLSAELPRSFSDYVTEKMEYNEKGRDPSDIDSSVYERS